MPATSVGMMNGSINNRKISVLPVNCSRASVHAQGRDNSHVSTTVQAACTTVHSRRCW